MTRDSGFPVARFFVNIHIPKCGGTTFRGVLHRNFRGRCEQVYNLLWEGPYTADQLAFFIDDSPGIDCISSHRLSLDLPFGRTGREIVALCFVRDPVERLLSHYFYERNRTYERRHFAHLRELSPEQFVERVLTEPREQYLLDYQHRYLATNVPDLDTDGIRALVDSGRLLPLPLERFDEALLVLQATFPDRFRDVRYVRQNESKKDRAFDPALRARVVERMPRDLALHALANSWLDAQIAQRFADRATFDSALAVHRGRCRRHELFAVRPSAWAKRVLGRLARLFDA